jgi:hypothetical protein
MENIGRKIIKINFNTVLKGISYIYRPYSRSSLLNKSICKGHQSFEKVLSDFYFHPIFVAGRDTYKPYLSG